MPGDSVLFGNIGQTNVVNIPATVLPGTITVNTTTNYTFTGNGMIGGNTSLTVSNGTLTILSTNDYTGPTILDGGILATPLIANSTGPSGIGAASAASANLLFNGGTLYYTGPSTSTDHGLTLNNGGGAIEVTNGSALTLNGSIIGIGQLTVEGSGTLILNNANSYSNTTTIAASTLQLNNASGAGSGTINFSNSSLVYYPSLGIEVLNAFNFAPGTTNVIVVTPGGSANPISDGNWTGGGVILISNTYNPYTVNGNLDGFTGTIVLDTPNNAAFRFNSHTDNTCFGSTNATFYIAGNGTNASLISRNTGIMNLGALEGSRRRFLSGPSTATGTATWSVGWNNLSTTYPGGIADFSGTQFSALIKVGTGTLTLDSGNAFATNTITDPNTGFPEIIVGYNPAITYSGATIVSNGVLALIAPAAITNSASVTLASPVSSWTPPRWASSAT